MDIPKKLNERPTIWLGLTLSELSRMGLITGSILSLTLGGMGALMSFRGALFGLLAAILLSVGVIWIWARIAAKRKSGKPYGYSDQLFTMRLSRMGFNFSKFPGVTSAGVWFHKRIKQC